MRTRAEIVDRARLYVGHRETEPNGSPLIRAWLRRCGVSQPAPWCAAFASWCIESRELAGEETSVALAGAVALGSLFPDALIAEPGDIMWFRTGPWQGHCGIVVAVDRGQLLCVEGNHRDQVALTRRLRNEVEVGSTRRERWGADTAWAFQVFPDAPLVRRSIEGTR